MTVLGPGEHPGCAHCQHQGWLISVVPGPVIDGKPTTQEFARPCPGCNPLHPTFQARAFQGRDDPAIERHRRHQARRMGRTDE